MSPHPVAISQERSNGENEDSTTYSRESSDVESISSIAAPAPLDTCQLCVPVKSELSDGDGWRDAASLTKSKTDSEIYLFSKSVITLEKKDTNKPGPGNTWAAHEGPRYTPERPHEELEDGSSAVVGFKPEQLESHHADHAEFQAEKYNGEDSECAGTEHEGAEHEGAESEDGDNNENGGETSKAHGSEAEDSEVRVCHPSQWLQRHIEEERILGSLKRIRYPDPQAIQCSLRAVTNGAHTAPAYYTSWMTYSRVLNPEEVCLEYTQETEVIVKEETVDAHLNKSEGTLPHASSMTTAKGSKVTTLTSLAPTSVETNRGCVVRTEEGSGDAQAMPASEVLRKQLLRGANKSRTSAKRGRDEDEENGAQRSKRRRRL